MDSGSLFVNVMLNLIKQDQQHYKSKRTITLWHNVLIKWHTHTPMLLGIPPDSDLFSPDCICLIIPPVVAPLLCFLLGCVWLCVAMLSLGALASLWVPLVVVREINCGRAVNYSSWVLKGLEHMLTPVSHASIRAQSVPMGPLSVRLERPQQYQWHRAQKRGCLLVWLCEGLVKMQGRREQNSVVENLLRASHV